MKIMAEGYLALVLHAHLPFIRHPEYGNFLEENWLFEAITDTYVPLISVFDGLLNDNVDFRVTISVSPTLISMLRDELLVGRYSKYLDQLIRLTEMEVKRTKYAEDFNKLAVMYREKYKHVRYVFFKEYGGDLTTAFKKFQDLGKVELITCPATHAYLPLMDINRKAVRAQVKVGLDLFTDIFKKKPKGIWLPECGYHPGHEEILDEFGIKYFFIETHGLRLGSPKPKYDVYSPYLCNNSNVAVFARDPKSSKAVWSAREGYPGDSRYREYYRDIGFDLEYDYIRPFINACGRRVNTGIKYYRVTGSGGHKDVYDRVEALKATREHADHFLEDRVKHIKSLSETMDRPPVIVAPYDAELFGHWWFEGPEWLECLLRKINSSSGTLKLTTPSEYLSMNKDHIRVQPTMSSWGYGGYSEVWLNGANDWIYKHLHKMAELMTKAAEDYDSPSDIERQALNQMARELMLAEASDWAFIMKTGTFTEYAQNRTREHISRFILLHNGLRGGNIDVDSIEKAQNKYNLFKDIDYKVYAGGA